MIKLMTAGAFALTMLLGGCTTHAEPAPLMTVLIKPDKVDEAGAQGHVDVTLTFPVTSWPAGESLLSMGMFTPGLARPQKLLQLQVADAAGEVSMSELPVESGPKRWAPDRPVDGKVVVRYRLLVENIPALSGGPPTALRVDGDAISAVGGALIMTPAVEGDHRIVIQWDTSAMGSGAEGVSSYGDGDVALPAGPVARLGRAVYMAGHLVREPADGSRPFSAVWVDGQPPFDPRPAMQWTERLHTYMSEFFGDQTVPPYRVFLRYNPMNAGGGAALTNSFIVTYGTGVSGESIQAILGHEMTHTWTAVDIGKWYSEGNAVYYQTLLPWRAGMITADQYLEDINRTAYRYFTNAMRDTPEDQVVPRFWEDTRIRVLPYDRGAMYFAVLDGKIRRASGGERSIDDLVRAMVQRRRDGQLVTEAAWLDLLRAEIGEEGQAVHASMLAGGLMLPESEDFGPCFRRVVKRMRRFDLGFDNASFVSNPKVIQGLDPDSEAAKAGLRNGDQVSYAVALDSLQSKLERTLDLQVIRGGETFPVSYRPRGAEVDAYQWERVPDASASACR